ncbi:transposase [Rhodococcus wratislaviensis]|uniref:transposase n=1 Tax=Rhodococcus wratislaviensis TaxID=44752 RepID=UPI00278BB52A|nr:transposase [Rhodococcus wratislaviensis]
MLGLGPDAAAALFVTVGDNPDRLRSESSFAQFCGVTPILASSSNITRHKLIAAVTDAPTRPCTPAVVVRLKCSDEARACANHRTAEDKSMPEILRCQKRYLA